MKTLTVRLLWFGVLAGFAQDAKSATVLYSMTRNGLLYSSADGAKSWQNIVLPGAPTLAVFSALAVDPQDSSKLYVDIGPADRVHPGDQTNYFYRSSDGGATWSQSNPPRAAELLAVDPASSNILYLGTASAGGLFRSTDSGATWNATSITTPLTGINTDPHRSGVVYVTTNDGKIYKSSDFGATLTSLASSLPPGFNRLLSVAADPNNSSVLWGTGEGSCVGANNLASICGLVQSSDGGKTWQAISSVKGWFKNVVVDPRNGNIYAGGQDDTLAVASQALAVKSTDGGKTWTKIATGMSKFSAEVHLDPEIATTLYAEQANLIADLGPGGGVYVSTDAGASWKLSPVDSSQGQNDLALGLAAVSKTAQGSPPAITSVVNAAGFQPGVMANSWVTLQGTNLAPKTDDWSHSIVNGNLPTSLDGVNVTMGGKAAYVYYISPGQLNVLAPDIPAGPVTVTVTTSGGVSANFAATASVFGPAFFLWPGSQVVATRQDYSYAVKAGTFAGATTVPAKPGDVLILWATGFGPTNPAPPSGVSVPANGSYPTTSMPTVTVNNTPAVVYGAALAPGSAGLYQIAIQVPPTLADGDWPIQASIGSVQSPTGTVLSIQK
jgi:uncharacterized protein (TIGR03437 family)